MLAPIMDGMALDDVKRRLTAAGALRLFEKLRPQMTEWQLNQWPMERDQNNFWDTYDRWRCLPDDFTREWSIYRPKAPSVTTRVLRRVCRHPWGYYAVTSARRLLRFLSTF